MASRVAIHRFWSGFFWSEIALISFYCPTMYQVVYIIPQTYLLFDVLVLFVEITSKWRNMLLFSSFVFYQIPGMWEKENVISKDALFSRENCIIKTTTSFKNMEDPVLPHLEYNKVQIQIKCLSTKNLAGLKLVWIDQTKSS
jgi:hypothetical protein